MQETRTKKSARNASIGLISQIVSLILNFAVRTALVWGLGSYYLGLNSVMTSLVAVFSLAELGLGNAIIYSLYRPLANGDERKIGAYLRVFKIMYRIIGCVILLFGLIALPLLPFLVNTEVTSEVLFAYLLYVANTALTYFLYTYRTTLIQANQEKYLVTISELIYATISAAFQIAFFVFFQNYILAVGSQMIAQVGKSFFILWVSKKRYSHIDFSSKEKLKKGEKRELARNVYAMALGKFSDTAANNVPALAISSIIGLIQSGLYSNYQIISNAVIQLMSQVTGAVTASVGNLNVEGERQSKESVFKQLSFLSFCGYTICSACVYVGVEPFVSAWLGEGYCLSSGCSFALAFNLLTIGILQSTVIFKDACGIFFRGRFRPVISCILTVIFSIALAFPFGVVGVMFAPAISRLLTTAWYDSWLVFRYVFSKKPFKHYMRMFGYLVAGVIFCLIADFVTAVLPGESWVLFVESILCALLVSFLLIVLFFHRYEPFVWLRETIVNLLKK